jgi:D-3-phosphoglycerate dehydrogenase
MRLSVAKDKLKFVLLEGIHESAVAVLKQDGYTNVATYPKALAGEPLTRALADAHFLGIRSRTQLTEAVLEQAPRLAGIGAFCIGTNQIDLRAAMKRGIPVFNAPFSNTRSVAELVLAEIVMLMRGIPQKNALLHRGGWSKSAAGSFEVRGKTLGIVGYGHIGTQIGVLAEQLGMSVLFHDIETKLALGNARQAASLEDLLAAADVVSLHVPETPATLNMIGTAQLETMKPGSHLINASRGTVVDIPALAAALQSGHLQGAAIDVFPVEPQGNDTPFESELVRFDNVILTPHIGGSTPEVALPEHTGRCRLLHVHRNVPGVMAQVNERFSRAGINVAAQYLRTNDEVGYVVIDVDVDASAVALDELCSVPATIRCRVLY